MSTILQIIIGYIVLYVVIWLHEVGHAIFFWKSDCKEHPLKVSVHWYLYASTPAPVDYDKLSTIPKCEYVMASYGGILANLIFSIITIIIIKLISINSIINL